MRAIDRLAGDLLDFSYSPAIGCKILVVLLDELSDSVRLGPNYRMGGLTQEAEENFVPAMEEVETGIGEDPIVWPIVPSDPVLAGREKVGQ